MISFWNYLIFSRLLGGDRESFWYPHPNEQPAASAPPGHAADLCSSLPERTHDAASVLLCLGSERAHRHDAERAGSPPPLPVVLHQPTVTNRQAALSCAVLATGSTSVQSCRRRPAASAAPPVPCSVPTVPSAVAFKGKGARHANRCAGPWASALLAMPGGARCGTASFRRGLEYDSIGLEPVGCAPVTHNSILYHF